MISRSATNDIAIQIVKIVKQNKDHLTQVLTNSHLVFDKLCRGEILYNTSKLGKDDIVLGFVHFHIRKDGRITLYEIAKSKSWNIPGFSIGTELVDALKRESRVIELKCSARNKEALKFWKKRGFVEFGFESRWNSRKNRRSLFKRLFWSPWSKK